MNLLNLAQKLKIFSFLAVETNKSWTSLEFKIILAGRDHDHETSLEEESIQEAELLVQAVAILVGDQPFQVLDSQGPVPLVQGLV